MGEQIGPRVYDSKESISLFNSESDNATNCYKEMNLPEDVLVDILSRLPVRSLIRLKCVSKRWYALIESPHFIDIHMTLQVTRCDERIRILQRFYNVLNCFDDIESLRQLTPPLDIELPGYQISEGCVDFAGHASGIVCITNRDSITLWNPVLREFRMLPSRPSCCPSGFSSQVFGVGLGFDHATNDYKVVCLETIVKDYPIEVYSNVENSNVNYFDLDDSNIEVDVVQVYNLKTNSWKRLETKPQLVPDDLVGNVMSPIFFQGCVHWCVWGNHLRVILTFNITSELFGEVQCPRGCEEFDFSTSTSRLFILDKSTFSLVVVFTPTRFHPVDIHEQVHIWVMNDYHVKDSWTKLYSIAPGSGSVIGRPLSFWKKDKLLLLTIDGVLIYYDLLTDEEHDLRQFDAPRFHGISAIEALTCIETLFSIK